MKFTDGYWLLREGVRAAYPVRVHDVRTGPGTLEVTAPTFPVRHRGDLLKGPVLSVGFSAPAEGVIRVSVAHYTGQAVRGPRFELMPEANGAVASVAVEEAAATLTSG